MGCYWFFGLLAVITSFWGPKWFLILSAVFSFLAGYLLGAGGEDGSVAFGIFSGAVFTIVLTVGGISTRYFQSRGAVDGIIDILMAIKSLFHPKQR
jgi:hypothetical protein